MWLGAQEIIVKPEPGETFEEWCERVCQERHGKMETAWIAGGVWVIVLFGGRMITSE